MNIKYVFLSIQAMAILMLLQGCNSNSHGDREDHLMEMKREFINPEGLSKTKAYTQVTTIQNGKMIFISGQVPFNEKGELIGKGDLRSQAGQIFKNLKIALQSAGATFDDVIKVTYYIKDYVPADLPIIREMRAQYFNEENPPSASLIGVQSLFLEDVLIEVEVVAGTK